jgi:hypothetical protein
MCKSFIGVFSLSLSLLLSLSIENESLVLPHVTRHLWEECDDECLQSCILCWASSSLDESSEILIAMRTLALHLFVLSLGVDLFGQSYIKCPCHNNNFICFLFSSFNCELNVSDLDGHTY